MWRQRTTKYESLANKQSNSYVSIYMENCESIYLPVLHCSVDSNKPACTRNISHANNQTASHFQGLPYLSDSLSLFLSQSFSVFSPYSEAMCLTNLNLFLITDLSFNNIEVIEGLETLTKLEDLTLYNNRISRIENMDALVNLHVFSIGNNDLKELENVGWCGHFN